MLKQKKKHQKNIKAERVSKKHRVCYYMSNIAYILYAMANIPTNIESKCVGAIDNWVFIENC